MWCIRKAASHNKDCLCFSLLPSHACLFVLWGGASVREPGECRRPLVSCWAGKTPNSPVPPPTQTFQLSLCCATYRSFHFGFCMTVLLVRKGYIAWVPSWEIPRPTATKLVLNFREASDRSQHQCIAASCEEHQCIAASCEHQCIAASSEGGQIVLNQWMTVHCNQAVVILWWPIFFLSMQYRWLLVFLLGNF